MTVNLQVIGDSSKMQKAIDDGIKKMEKLNERILKNTREMNKNRDSARKLREEDAKAKKVKAEVTAEWNKMNKVMLAARTPINKYNDSMRELYKMETLGVISAEQHAAARRHLKKVLEEEERAIEQNTDEYKRHIKVQKEMQAVLDRNRTKTELYNQTLKRWRAEVGKGNITMQQFRASAAALRRELEATSKQGGSLANFAAGFATAATAVAAIRAGIQASVDAMKELVEMEAERADAQMTTAQKAEQAMRNLPLAQQQQAMDMSRDLTMKYGVDNDAAVLAVGSAVTAAGGNFQIAEQALNIGAQYGRLTPEDMTTYTTAIGDVMKASGLGAAQSASLIESTGIQSRIQKASKVGAAVTPGIRHATSVYKDDELAAKQAAALLAALSNLAVDKTGEASRTATVQMLQKIDETFSNLPGEIVDAQNRLGKLQRADSYDTSAERIALDANALQTRQATFNRRFTGGETGRRLEERKKEELAIKEMTASLDASRRKSADDQRLRNEAIKTEQDLINALQGLQGQDSSTLFKRFDMFAASVPLTNLLNETEFGEQQFKKPMEMLLDGTLMPYLRDTASKISTDETLFHERRKSERDAIIRGEKGFIGAAQDARAAENIAAMGIAADTGDIYEAKGREIVAKTLENTRVRGATGVGDYLGERLTGVESSFYSGDKLARTLTSTLLNRERTLQNAGGTPEQFDRLLAGVTAYGDLLEDRIANDNDLSKAQIAGLDRMAEVLDRLEGKLEGMGATIAGASP